MKREQWVRQCSACGRLDYIAGFVEDPQSPDVWAPGAGSWSCAECGGSAFELVESPHDEVV